MKPAFQRIEGHEKIIEIFGEWPSFHDSEVLSVNLDRRGTSEFDGPVIAIQIHVFSGAPTNDGASITFTNHHVITFEFREIHEVEMHSFNNQNALFDLQINSDTDAQQEHELFRVLLQPSYGLGCELKCEKIRIASVEPKLPEGSVYGQQRS